MANNKRLRVHLALWGAYFSITLFNELYLTSDFAGQSNWAHFLKIFISELNLLCVKIALVYYLLYSYIPRWMKTGDKNKLITEFVVITLLSVVVYRLIIQYINWELILHQAPTKLNWKSYVARYFFSLLEIIQVVAIAATLKFFALRISAIENEKELIREKMKAELGHLKSQINPHFLFNTLNSIYSLSLIQSPQTPEIVLRLSSLLRFMLYESEKITILINDEIKIINDYVEMQQLRFENRVNVTRIINLDNESTAIAPLMLFPFVENAFKHGIGGKGDQAFIHIVIELSQGLLKMSTRNFISKETVVEKDEGGIGLSNIKKQLQLLYGDYSLKTENQENVFEVTLQINLHSYAGNELYHSRR